VTEDLNDRLISYLTDAHSIEEQALAQLRSAPAIAGAPRLADAFRQHLAETEGHERAVEQLLEARDAGPSWFKDAVMKVGGKGFVLFAKANPDTPGKLLAHALSYEALEEASYALLANVAEQAGDSEVAETAERIRREEVAMKARLEACFDDAVDASLAAVGTNDLDEQLSKYLADAHALEQQAIGLLERASKRDGGGLAEAYRKHLVDNREHADAVAARLQARGGEPSTLKDTFMRTGAFSWATFFEAHPDTPAKRAAFAYAFEHLEIGGYEQLKRVAERAGDQQTADMAAGIIKQERSAADALKRLFPEAAEVALAHTTAGR
jgi:ferritin-like metal-binding protein YciE